MDKKIFIIPNYNINKKIEEPKKYIYDVIKKEIKKETNHLIVENENEIIINYFDISVLGKIASLLGKKNKDAIFWNVAESIEQKELYNLYKIEDKLKEKYFAYLAYQEAHRINNITQKHEITDIILKYIEIIDKILDGDEKLIKQGQKWEKEIQDKISTTLIYENENIRVFNTSEVFFNSLAYYSEKQEKVIPCTIIRDETNKAISISMADDGEEFPAKKLVQELWGNEAGGYKGIATSPRGQKMTVKDLQKTVYYVNNIYENNKPIYFEVDEIEEY